MKQTDNRYASQHYFRLAQSLYKDTEFGRWLEAMPENVKSDYSEWNVDMGGTRVTVTFFIEDEEE